METLIKKRSLGITFNPGNKRAQVKVWAPGKSGIQINIPEKELNLSLKHDKHGYWTIHSDRISPGDRYHFIIDNQDSFPDPASISQPDGVHGLSEAVNLHEYEWADASWSNHPLAEYVIYELHAGTFTEEGTLLAIADKLSYLKKLGINAIEIMPVAQFPGPRNWGYDGAFPFAVQNTYGGYKALQQLVDACHKQGIAVILDVVYNHLGPEGNYLGMYGPYFTNNYKTPWGQAINFDDAGCDGVRNYYLENALMWFRDFHIDALRLDAVHAIKDMGAKHFLAELADHVSALEKTTGKNYYLIAECDLNDPKYIRNRKDHGYGMHAQWIDEFHHALRVTAGESSTGYYSDFKGITQLAKSYSDAYVYDGVFSQHRQRTFGSSVSDMLPEKFVVFSQNHDQTGNRMMGERTSQLVSFEMQKLMAGAVLLSPYIPLLFMGEEFSASSPFLYFVSHTDKKLVEAVRKGRKEEFKEFHANGEPPDPQSESTFLKSKILWSDLGKDTNSTMLEYYTALIDFRKKYRKFISGKKKNLEVSSFESEKIITLNYRKKEQQLLCLLNFSSTSKSLEKFTPKKKLQILFNSADPAWLGKYPVPGGLQKPQDLQIPSESITIYLRNNA